VGALTVPYHNIKMYGRVEIELYTFLTSAPDGGEWSTSRQGHFTPTEKVHDTHWIGAWMDLSAGSNMLEEKEEIS
jgi:hypothetical protein